VPKARQKIAQGVSPGKANTPKSPLLLFPVEPRKGRQKFACVLSPLAGLKEKRKRGVSGRLIPRAYALGYSLSPRRGCHDLRPQCV
jgi:hypothetical protein